MQLGLLKMARPPWCGFAEKKTRFRKRYTFSDHTELAPTLSKEDERLFQSVFLF